MSVDISLLSASCRYGHGVLRNPDPRFMALQEFCETLPELLADPIVQLVKKVSSAVIHPLQSNR